MVFIYSSSGELSAYTFRDNENKYLIKKLDDTNTKTKKTVSSKKPSEKRNAYERSRKRVNTSDSNTENEMEKESIFERFLNIFSDDSQEDVE